MKTITDADLLSALRRIHVRLMRGAMDATYTVDDAIAEGGIDADVACAARAAMDATGASSDLDAAYEARRPLRRAEALRALASGEFDWIARMR